MSKREEKIASIIGQTIQLLKNEGIGGLSMRKVADQTGIRLSNLQYYFKDRNELLKTTIAHYFKLCEQEVLEVLPPTPPESKTEITDLLKTLLAQALVVGSQSDQCTMFREIWALSSRDEPIGQLVQQYYRNYCQWLAQLMATYTPQPQVVISLMLPYIEGYSIMGEALPINKEEVIEMLVQVIGRLL